MATTTSATATVSAKPTQAARHRRENSSRPSVATAKRALTGTGDETGNKRRKIEQEPLVRDNAYILSKFAGNPPSLIVHLYDDFWRLDGQESSFSYGQNSPMQVFLRRLREGAVPHELLPDLHQLGVQFYDGCLIVQVKNHRSAGVKPEGITERRGKDDDGNVRFSMHNWNEHITPSPYVPFPRKAQENHTFHKKGPSGESKTNGSMPPPDSKDPKKDGKNGKDDGQDKKDKPGPRVTTTVLHPTTLSMHVEMLMLAATPLVDLPNASAKKGKDGRTASIAQPPTPSLAAPSTPLSMSARKDGQKMCLEPEDLYKFEAERLVATAAPLYLEPVRDAKESDALIEALSHPLNSARPPSPKTRKRTTAELAAEDAAAAEIERRMLIMDERIKPAGLSSKGTTGESGQQAAMGGLAFGRFKTIELVRAQHEEKEAKRREEEARAAEARKAQEEARANSTASQAPNGNAGMATAAAAAAGAGNVGNLNQMPEAQRRLMQQRLHQHQRLTMQAAQQAQVQAQQEAQQRQQQQQQLQAQIQAQQQAQNNQQNAMQASQQSGHPPGSAGGMMAGQANVSMTQQSPIVRNQTPNTNLQSSPMIPQVGFPMTQSGSQQGMTAAGSPARPSSAVPMNHPINMTRNGSHQQGTPQMPHSTPQIPNRNMNNASAMGQRVLSGMSLNQQQPGTSSPADTSSLNAGTPMNPMVTPHMSNPGLQMAPGLTPDQIAILQQQQRQQHFAQQQAHLNSMGQGAMNAGSPANGMTPGQFSQARASGQQQQQYQAQVRHMMAQMMAQNPQMTQQLALQRAQAIIKARTMQQAQILQQNNMQNQGGNAGSPMAGGQGHPQQSGGGFGGTPQMGAGSMAGVGGDQQPQQHALMQARQQQIMAQQRTMQQQQQQGLQQLQQIASQHGGQIPQQVIPTLPQFLQLLLRQQQQQQLARMRAASAAQGQRAAPSANMPSTDDREQYMAALRQQKMFLGQMNGQGTGGGGMNMGGGAGGLNMGGQGFNGQGNDGSGEVNQRIALMQAALQGGGGGQRPGQGSGM
ncbi:hypothetical protein K431DRAFT_288680 [Polychaeton citri CBS 116435]|uniref:Spt20-like SEP domain-containing protein n=1 Tax=Polychaeton citri CBS 116435 TaxID=1314669 RepID=A0A9P4UL00_9PEZI|nr:hypothetical protein K431DRAFT_288680 [Polychaeton citri CBS 116435]